MKYKYQRNKSFLIGIVKSHKMFLLYFLSSYIIIIMYIFQLSYLIEIWGSSTRTQMYQLQVLQNKLMKLIFKYHYLTPTKKIYNETKIMHMKTFMCRTFAILSENHPIGISIPT